MDGDLWSHFSNSNFWAIVQHTDNNFRTEQINLSIHGLFSYCAVPLLGDARGCPIGHWLSFIQPVRAHRSKLILRGSRRLLEVTGRHKWKELRSGDAMIDRSDGQRSTIVVLEKSKIFWASIQKLEVHERSDI
jgi:hypothetical protein